MTDYILETKNLTKTYGDKQAIDQVSIQIKRGAIYGLIGRNGAGKTTLLKIISGLAFQTDGEVLLFGERTAKTSNLLERVGVLIEAPGLYPNLTAYENVRLKCIAYGINREGYITSLLEQVGLDYTGEKKTRHFSLGMKQRLAIALALVGEPDLLLLDEPANGLDPQGIIEIRGVLLKLSKEQNITIIISSHILEELAKIVTRIGIIDEGKLLEEIDKEELFEKTKDKIEIKTENVERTIVVLEEQFGIEKLKVIDQETLYVYEKIEESGAINKALVNAEITIHSLAINRESLEDYFINLTGGGSRV